MTPHALIPLGEAVKTPFAELAQNIRQNVNWAKQVGGDPLDPDLLLVLVNELEKKIGGRRPELPPSPVDPFQLPPSLPPSRPTKYQLRTKNAVIGSIKQGERRLLSRVEKTRREAELILKELRLQLEELNFRIAISGLPAFRKKQALAQRGSAAERSARADAFKRQLSQYREDTQKTRRAIEKWDLEHSSDPAGYAMRLRIANHLRTDVEAYARGDLRVPIGKVTWHILPSGPWRPKELAAIHDRVRRRNPMQKADEARLPYADSLRPIQKFVGVDEFEGYFVFLFQNTDRVLLENPLEGNAAYIFKGDWTYLSKLSKGDLLSEYRHYVERVLHRQAGNWRWRIKQALAFR